MTELAKRADLEESTNPPFSTYERLIAGRYLRARRKETFISVIAGFSFVGITLGVATLIIVMAVMNGFRTELLDRILGMNGHVMLYPVDGELTDFADVTDRVNMVEGLKFAVPIVEGQALVSGSGQGTGALIRGIREEDLKKIRSVANTIQLGTLEGFNEATGVAIGSGMARNLGLTVGDQITIVSPDGDVTPFGTTPRVKAYPVDAIFNIGMSEYDSSIIFMPLVEAQLFFNMEDKVTVIEIYVDDPDEVDELRPTIEKAADRPLMLQSWQQRNQTLFSALEVERNVMFFILLLIVLVAALNIISGLTMLVKDKGRDIAILRTMGATRASVMRIFFLTGSAIGFFGTIAGFLLGVVVCLNVENIRQFFSWLSGQTLFNPELYFLSQLPARMDPLETAMIVFMAMGLSFLATLYPAWRAARLDPVEALRYE